MSGVVIAGLPIPSASPVFLAGVAVHIALGLTAVATGAAAMLSPKGPGRHPRFGSIYVAALAGLFVTATALGVTRWAEDWPLVVLGALAFASGLYGRQARRGRWPRWALQHGAGMAISYILMLTAFYVDNGPNLPLWRELPRLALWLGPGAVGLPWLALVLARHPLVRGRGGSAA